MVPADHAPTSDGPDALRRGVLVIATLAAVLGLLAAITTSSALAVVAGSLSLLAAVGAFRLTGTAPRPGAAAAPTSPAGLETEPASTEEVSSADGVSGDSVAQAPPRPPVPPVDEGIVDIDLVLLPDGESRVVDPHELPHPEAPVIPPPALLPEGFLARTLQGRVAVARRALRPLSIVCFEVVTLHDDEVVGPVSRSAIEGILLDTLRESDVAGMLGTSAYACILEETAEDGAVWTAERLRQNLTDGASDRRFRAGIAAYPAHGLEPDELWTKVTAALDAARDWSRDRIEVATGS